MRLLSYSNIEIIKNEILDHINHFDEKVIKEYMHEKVDNIVGVSVQDRIDLFNRLEDSIFKYDVIQRMLDDSEITEVMINGTNHIFVEQKGKLKNSGITFECKAQLMQLIHKIATEVGREINIGNPIMDARLKDGSRVNVILDPIAMNGPIVTIRKFHQTFSNPDELMAAGMFTKQVCELLERLIKSKYNIFICGSTGSGKTTLLSSLTSYIDSNDRIITIEDAAEIKITQHTNLVTMETRQHQNVSHQITMSTLIKNALRMRPDRIIVGEVRGPEVVDMLQAMNTGHEGSISTGHSNSTIDMLVRLEVIASSYSEINHLLIRKQIMSAIDVLIYVEKLPSGERKITEISEVIKGLGDYHLNALYKYDKNNCLSFDEMIAQLINTEKYRRYYESI